VIVGILGLANQFLLKTLYKATAAAAAATSSAAAVCG
jgi:hypothetical protein